MCTNGRTTPACALYVCTQQLVNACRLVASAAASSTVERLTELRPETELAITDALGNCLTETNLDIGPVTVVSLAPCLTVQQLTPVANGGGRTPRR